MTGLPTSVLALDAGNSALKGALVRPDGAVLAPFRLGWEAGWPGALRAALAHLPEPPVAAGLASVVPARTAEVEAAVREVFALDIATVHAGRRLPFTMGYATPATLGADRIAAVAGALALRNPAPVRALVVLDAGTALTLDAVTSAGVHVGGAIAPGPRLLMESLARGTALLPDVPLAAPLSPIGRSTTEGLQAGVVLGFVEAARGLLRRTLDALGEPAFVVATGGWAGLLAAEIAEINEVRPYLVLEGVAQIIPRPSGPPPLLKGAQAPPGFVAG